MRWRWVSLMVAVGIAAGGCDSASAPSQGDESARTVTEAAEPASAPEPEPAPVPAPARAPRGDAAEVARVVDGDTIDLGDGTTVRLVQIDTPETYSGAECGGAAATSALTRALPSGTRVRLRREPESDDADRYGRLLRYVVHERRVMNVWMVAQGHAAPYFYNGERGRYAAQLERLARDARTAKRGLWGACPSAVLDARRGVSTGALSPAGTSGARDASAGAGALRRLPPAPAYPPDVDCGDLPGPVRVTADDPHRLDGDGDGVGCD